MSGLGAHFRLLKCTIAILALAAVAPTSAQAPRVAFSLATTTDLTIPDPVGRVVADFNQDGHLDLIVTGSNSVKLFTGNGSGAFSAATSGTFGVAGAAAVADFNGDGYLDVVVAQDFVSKQSIYGDMCGSTI